MTTGTHLTISVLHNFATLNLGGAESRTMDVVRQLSRDDFNFHFVTYESEKQHFEDEILQLGGRIHRITHPRTNLIKHLYELSRLFRNENYHVLHSHTSHHSGLVALIAWLHRVPTRIAHARTSGSMSSTGTKGKVSRLLGRALVARFTTHRIAISPEAGKYVFGGRAKFSVLPNAFDISRYRDTEPQRTLRSVLGLPVDCVILGQVGRLAPVKNQEFSIFLLSRLVEKDANVRLVFVGEGAERDALERLASEKGLSAHIIFAGLQNNVSQWMTAFDVVLMPSLYEGLGVAVMEAQAAGTPVVASAAVPETTDMGLSLVTYLPLDNDTGAWLDATQRSLRVKHPSRAVIEAAFSTRHFTIEHAVSEHKKLYGASR